MNRCEFIGRIATDLELKTTPNGKSTMTFRLAVPRRYKDAKGERPTDFITCVAWQHIAEFIHKFIHKGDRVWLAGELQTRSYTGQDGLTRYVSEINVVEFEGFGTAQTRPQEAGQQAQDAGFTEISNADELPF